MTCVEEDNWVIRWVNQGPGYSMFFTNWTVWLYSLKKISKFWIFTLRTLRKKRRLISGRTACCVKGINAKALMSRARTLTSPSPLSPPSQSLCGTMLLLGLRADVLVSHQLQQLQGPEEMGKIRAHSGHVTEEEMAIAGIVLSFLLWEWSHRRQMITSTYPTHSWVTRVSPHLHVPGR